MLTIYSKNNCSACVQAKELLTREKIPFIVHNVDEDFEAFDFIVSEGLRSFPQIYKDGKMFVQGGYKGLLEAWRSGSLSNYKEAA